MTISIASPLVPAGSSFEGMDEQYIKGMPVQYADVSALTTAYLANTWRFKVGQLVQFSDGSWVKITALGDPVSVTEYTNGFTDAEKAKLANVPSDTIGITGELSETFEDGLYENSGYTFAQIDSADYAMVTLRGSEYTVWGDTNGVFNGVETFSDGLYDNCGYSFGFMDADDYLIYPTMPDEVRELPGQGVEFLNNFGLYENCGYAVVDIDSGDYAISIPSAVVEEVAETVNYLAYSADAGGGEYAIYSENRDTGQRTRLSSSGSSATEPVLDGLGNVLWSAASNTMASGDGRYYAPLAGGAEHAVRPIKKLACWGDSLTAQDWMQYLAAEGTTNTYYNMGRSGDTSLAVASRMGAIRTYYTVSGGSIPTSGAVSLTLVGPGDVLSKFGNADASVKGYLAGVWGTLAKVSGAVTFTRAASGSAVAVTTAEFVWGVSGTGDTDPTDEGDLIDNVLGMTHFFFFARNNASETNIAFSHFQACVNHIASYTKRFVIIPYLPTTSETSGTPGYNDRAALLALCQAEWPHNTVDVYQAFLDSGTPYADLFQGDGIHPNSTGQQIIAETVHNFIIAKGILA